MFLSTFQGFPAELILEIYVLSKNRNLIAVCTRFCDIFYSTRSLWTTINVRKDQATVHGPVYLLRRLERGGSCPLDVNIQSEEPIAKVEFEMWRMLTTHRYRFRTFTIQTDKMALCSKIMHKILIARGPPSSNSLQRLHILHEDNVHKPRYSSASCQLLLQSTAYLWPSLTTLHLPFVMHYIPYLSAPLVSLKTLILDGRMPTNIYPAPCFYQIMRLLVHMPRLTTMWFKSNKLLIQFGIHNASISPPDFKLGPPIRLPVQLPHLTRIALSVSASYGADILNAIEAPCLKELHLDGSYDLEQWPLVYYSSIRQIDETLILLAQQSPLLCRLALIGVPLHVDQWARLFGYGSGPLLFQHLTSIAIRGVAPTTRAGLFNTMDSVLLYECAVKGTIPLRRFAYTGMNDLLGFDALCKLVTVFSSSIGAGEYFELELDYQEQSNYKVRIEELQQYMAVRTTLHMKKMPIRGWWTHWDDIDPTEADSY